MRGVPWIQRVANALPDADTCDRLIVAAAVGVLVAVMVLALAGLA